MSAVSPTMRATVLTGHGGLDKRELHADGPAPVVGPGEVLIEVGACGINNTELNTRTACCSPPPTPLEALRKAQEAVLDKSFVGKLVIDLKARP